MDKIDEALKRCPDLKVVHVATYAKGDSEAKYWDKPDVKTHKVSCQTSSEPRPPCSY